MTLCDPKMGCGGSGHLLLSARPLKFVECPVCNGAGTFWPPVQGLGYTIPMHSPPQKPSQEDQFTFKLDDFHEGALMAHVMKEAGVFNSVGQARKNGWNQPIECGTFFVGKNKKKIVVE